ncbi:phosphatidate cytidylyltransferase [Bacillaceae bacterium Marseille-Q3522]|nr:phosphatidate cytidylyltransferase [Bacillaceae bacterium Marseille-Q3522]
MKQRIVTAIIFGAVLIPITIVGGVPLVLLTYLIATFALYEIYQMRKLTLASVHGLFSLILLWIFLLPTQILPGGWESQKIEMFLFTILLFLTYTVVSKNTFSFEDVAFSVLTVLYIGIGFYYFVEMRETLGVIFVFYSLLLMWATDSGAYFLGRAFGKRKLWPEISPNKTVEGFLGGVLCSLVVAVIFLIFFDLGISVFHLLLITVLLSIFGQIGDLAESALKRFYDVKDSGTILPGHGGILDRFDSLLFVWPLLHFFLFI